MSISKLDNLIQEHSELEIWDQTFKTKNRTILIESISTISLVKLPTHVMFRLLIRITGVFFILYGLGLNIPKLVGMTASHPLFEYYMTTLIVGLLFLLFSFAPTFRRYLVVSTNDGVRTLFHNGDIKNLKRIKKVLDERIENKASTRNYTINFDTGRIEELTVGQVDKISAKVAPAIIEKIDQQVETMQADTIISGSSDVNVAIASTGVVQGTHDHGDDIKFDQQVIDYANYLPVMEQWKDFMAQQKPDMTAQGQMEELIDLMKSGTKGPMEKARLQTLGQELSSYLKAYDGFSQLMGDIMRLVA